MKVRVVYVWDSDANTYGPDSSNVDVTVQPTLDDRMRWQFSTHERKPKTGIMNLTRGFEMLMYLAGLANDGATHAKRAKESR